MEEPAGAEEPAGQLTQSVGEDEPVLELDIPGGQRSHDASEKVEEPEPGEHGLQPATPNKLSTVVSHVRYRVPGKVEDVNAPSQSIVT